jgi:hypothetical protein
MLNDHCHRVSTQLQLINIIIIIIIIIISFGLGRPSSGRNIYKNLNTVLYNVLSVNVMGS